MKNMKLLVLLVCFFIIFSTLPSFASEIYGCWRSDQKYPLNVIKFDKTTYYYGKYSQPAKFYTENGVYIVQFTKYSTLRATPNGKNIINVVFPDPSLPKNITYERISDEEAVRLMEKH